MPAQPWVERAAAAARVDPSAHRTPATWRLVLATLLSLAGSLGADALLVVIGEALFPSTKGYSHFRLSDYGTLTVIGVVVACAAWPVTAWISWAPRWLFLRMAVLVTVLLWLPDLYLLLRGEPVRAVGVLVTMHLAIALVTYNLLVRLAPAEESRPSPLGRWKAPTLGSKRVGIVMAGLVGLELALGVGALVVVPYSRPDAWLPTEGRPLYLVHALLGALLGGLAGGLLLASFRAERMVRIGMAVGFAGVAIGAAGGFASVDHRTRLLGLGLMLLGTLVAVFGYLIPVIEASEPPAQPSPVEP